MHSLSTSSRHSQWIFNQLQFKQVAPCLVLLGPGEAWVILTMPSIAPPSWLEHMSALPFTLCDISRAYQICHPRSLLGDDSVANAPACQVRFDHRAVPAGSFESRLSSQTLSPCRWHHRLALTVIRWPSNAIQTGELSTCGQEGATPIILSALFSVSSVFTFHIPFTLKLPATSLALFWFCFICLLVFFFLIHPPIQGIIIRVFEENMVLFSYGPVLLLHWRSDHRPWMLEYIEHAVYHWAIANLLYRLLRSRPTDLIYAKFKWDQRHLRANTVAILIGSFVHFLGLTLKLSSFVLFACFFVFPAILKVWGGEGSKGQRF